MRTQADDYKDCQGHASSASTSREAYQSYGRCALDAACDTYGVGDLCAQLGPLVDSVVGAVYDAFSPCAGLDGDAADCCRDPSLPKCLATNVPGAPFGAVYGPLTEAVTQLAALLPTSEVTKQPAGWSTGSDYVVSPVSDAQRLVDAEYFIGQTLVAIDPDVWRIVNDESGVPEIRTWLGVPRTSANPTGRYDVGEQASITGQQKKDYAAHVWPDQVAKRQADIAFALAQGVAAHAGDLYAQAKGEALAAESAKKNAASGGGSGVVAVATLGSLGLLGFLLTRRRWERFP